MLQTAKTIFKNIKLAQVNVLDLKTPATQNSNIWKQSLKGKPERHGFRKGRNLTNKTSLLIKPSQLQPKTFSWMYFAMSPL